MASVANDNNKKPIFVIKKNVDGDHDDHHGGAWKVAYADFVTAMMAFFLMLWILNAVDEEKLEGIADYFEPTLIKQKLVTGEGVLSGITIGEEGVFNSSNSPMMTMPTPLIGVDDPGKIEDAPLSNSHEDAPSNSASSVAVVEMQRENKIEDQRREQNDVFDEISEVIRQAMHEIPDLEPLIPNVLFEKTNDGLRIQIVDQAKTPMFPIGSASMFNETRDLLSLVGMAISDIPNNVTITGHTDSIPYSSEDQTGYGNWELSADRANATRRALIAEDVDDNRIYEVSGVADNDPIMPENPNAPMNRRISITVLYNDLTNEISEEGNSLEEEIQNTPTEVQESVTDSQNRSNQNQTNETQEDINSIDGIPDWVSIEVDQ